MRDKRSNVCKQRPHVPGLLVDGKSSRVLHDDSIPQAVALHRVEVVWDSGFGSCDHEFFNDGIAGRIKSRKSNAVSTKPERNVLNRPGGRALGVSTPFFKT